MFHVEQNDSPFFCFQQSKQEEYYFPFELKYFFSSGVEQKDGAVISSLKIKEHIQKIISQENTKKPYTDSYMAEKLCELENIKVARRTIAKYRESLGIPSSNRRKRD